MQQEMIDLFSLKDKVIVVTGGTGVLGNAFVQAIAKAGGTVIIMGRNKTIATERANNIIAQGGKALALVADVLNADDLTAAKDLIVQTFGTIDGLVNAAGGNVPEAVIQPTADVFDMNMEGLQKAMHLNIWGTLLPSQIFGKVMAKQGFGSIVNISSVSGKRALTKVLGYSMGKAAIDCYTKWFATEVANRYSDKIRVNTIMPGFFLTEQNKTLLTQEDGSLTARGNTIIQHTPFKRFGNANELEGALIYLLSDASKFVTGTEIGVDGGFNNFSGV
ncbi:MAG: SDR family oxidoreductase [Chitinophagaceae bacterium]|jgi:NAD(P)-dependent dehydrogenase (short-subunit alcohol dehydrogenase family)|nr:SDR family oxidoreductase [Chitinophagaceae bacterium]